MKLDFFSRRKGGWFFPERCRLSGLGIHQCAEVDPASCSNGGAVAKDENSVGGAGTVCERAPESREARVAQLRQQVREGNYEIPFSQMVRILSALIRGKR